jgi:FHS family L-fucose permease-like MFS transporter
LATKLPNITVNATLFKEHGGETLEQIENIEKITPQEKADFVFYVKHVNQYKSYMVYASLAIILFSLSTVSASAATKIRKAGVPCSIRSWYYGMLAIFTYVGVEVTIQSNMGALLETTCTSAV